MGMKLIMEESFPTSDHPLPLSGCWPTLLETWLEVELQARFAGRILSIDEVALIREESMALFAGRLSNHAELYHALQGLRHGWRRKRKWFGGCWNRDDQLALTMLHRMPKVP